MTLNRTVTKKVLENIVHETFSTFGVFSSSSLLDSLKLLGFYYATNAGISINIEDLKTPDVKKQFIEIANKEIDFVSSRWEQGFISDNERFQSIIDSWNSATEGLKNRIVDYYQYFDPANNLYIMAFSGARGNMSQVRQLVGMRGLMSDQEGKIIDLPIQRNFREGLSSIDYIISSYGARKGIVDTALKTADSGYLTRRLIYLAQDLIIREIDCHSTEGVILFLKKTTKPDNFVGKNLIWAKRQIFPYESLSEKNICVNLSVFENLKKDAPLSLNFRSPLTCQSSGSICQTCYGWDLAKKRMISLGEAVGIIAAQSIGEPGTQLTMRTFHTGGIFTGEMLKQIVAPFSGKLILPKNFKRISYRTNHGVLVLKLKQETKVQIINWKGIESEISLAIGSFLYIQESCFLQKGALIAEYSTQSLLLGARRLKPIYSPFSGEIKFENLVLQTMSTDEGKSIRANPTEGVLWILAGKIFPIPKESKMNFQKSLNCQKSFAKVKLITLSEGWISFSSSSNSLSIINAEKRVDLELTSFIETLKNCSMKFIPLVKNYQFVDSHTTIAYLSIFPNFDGLIYGIRQKKENQKTSFLVVTESDVWKIHSDQMNDFSFFPKKKTLIRKTKLLNATSQFHRSGYFLKRNGFEMIFQEAIPIFLSPKTVLNYTFGDFVFKKQVLATLLNYTQQTEDIVQGLPKIEELIEARQSKEASVLASKPGIILNANFHSSRIFFKEKEQIFTIIAETENNSLKKFLFHPISKPSGKEPTKQLMLIGHNASTEDNLVIYRNSPYLATLIPNIYRPYNSSTAQKPKKNGYHVMFRNMEVSLLKKKPKEKKEEKEEQFFVDSNQKLQLKPGYETLAAKKIRKEYESFITKQINTRNFNKNLRVKGRKILSKFRDLPVEESDDLIIYKYENGKKIPWKKVIRPKKVYIIGPKKRKRYNVTSMYINRNEDLMVAIPENFVFLKKTNSIQGYKMPISACSLVELGDFVDLGEPVTEGIIDTHELLKILFAYHTKLDGVLNGTRRSVQKFQLILVNSIQAIYQSQGVNISTKHIEIIVKQMTAKVLIQSSGNTPFLPGEFILFSLMSQVCLALKDASFSTHSNANSNIESSFSNLSEEKTEELRSPDFNNQNEESFAYLLPIFEPKLLSATNSSLTKDSFLSAAGFQETRRVLSKAALEGSCDWLRGLKECIMIGRLIPAGSTFLNYKNYLDNVFSFSKEKPL